MLDKHAATKNRTQHMIKKAAIFALAIAVSSGAQAETYLCIADKSTGFSYNKTAKTWDIAKFKVKANRYLVKQTKTGWVWMEFGDKFEGPCRGDFYENTLQCEFPPLATFAMKFVFNRDSLRYQRIYPFGYLHDKTVPDTDRDTPFFEIGRCSLT